MPDPDRPRLVRYAGRAAWCIYHQRRRLSTGCEDRASALRVLDRYIRDLAAPQGEPLTVAGVLDRYLVDRTAAKIPGLARLTDAHKPLRRLLGAKLAEGLTIDDSRVYAAQRAAEGVTTGTARTELQALTAALGWCAKGQGLAAAPPVQLPPRSPPRERWLTRAEAARLIEACKPHHLRLFMLLALHTAARSGAIRALTWDRVDLEHRRLDYRLPAEIATRKRKIPVPINDTLAVALAYAHERCTSEWVVEWAGAEVGSIKHGFSTAARLAGLPGVTPHTLRHTAVTWMLQAGISVWDAAGFAGMSPEMVRNTYGHHHPDYHREAARALG